jgi:ketosteroid isomerase-like protein
VVRRFYESWNERDLEAVLACVHDEFRFDWSDSRSPFSGVYEGREGLLQFWRDGLEAWDEFALEIEDEIECERDRIVTATLVRGRGKGSGIEVEARGAMLWTLREKTLLEGKLFQTKEDALEAAGASSA